MVVLDITTYEVSAQGDAYSRYYLFDTESHVLIADTKTDPYISYFNSEIAKVIGLVEKPNYKQRGESGWHLENSERRVIPREKSGFDGLVKRLSPRK